MVVFNYYSSKIRSTYLINNSSSRSTVINIITHDKAYLFF